MPRKMADILAARRARKSRRPVVEDKALRPDAENKWTLGTPPDEYLERWPDGPNADLARKVLGR